MGDWIDLSQKVALVTGSSRGIGAAIVQALDRQGARCIVNYVETGDGRNKADAESVAATLHDAMILQCDVGDDVQVRAMFEQIEKARVGLDILVNNAGVIRDRSLKKMTPADWDFVLRVNLTGTFNVTQQATRLLRAGGRIVNLSSLSGTAGFFGQANYAASKAGVVALTKVAARELARQQITVNAIAPGFIDTEMSRTMPADVAAKFREQIPLGRLGEVGDIADVVLFLCSAHAGYITGQTLHVNGGFYME